jgi:acyl-coenzyme A thioesterase PaaI-like protein
MPLCDFSNHDPDFSSEQLEQCTRIIDGLRAISNRIVRIGGSLEDLTSVANRVEGLLDSLDPVTQRRELESYRYQFDPEHPNRVIPFNPATGEFNPIAPAMKMTLEGETLVATLEFGNCYESAPDTVQGGMVSAVYDQLLAYSVMVAGATGPTLWLKVSFLKPTPINQPLRFEAVVESIERKKYAVKGRCYCADELVSEAEALCLGSYPIPRIGQD